MTLLGSTLALAEPAPAAAPGTEPAAEAATDDDEPPLPYVPAAADTLGGHFVVGAAALVEAPVGKLRQGENAAGLGPGFGGTLDLGFGVGRAVVLGAWGNFVSYGSHGSSFALGPFVRYHLVQGLRFDPWILAGAGYRSLTRDSGPKRQFSGFELAHVAIGGEYYAWSGLGFGPWLGLDLGIYGTRPKTNSAGQPDAASVDADVHLGFAGGLRVVLDLPGK